MNDRFKILDDKDFWLNLEFILSGDFAESEDNELRKYWIDGFNPEYCSNTKNGIEVEGMVWIAEGGENQYKFKFKMKVPQDLLHRNIKDFKYEVISFDFNSKYFKLAIQK